MHPTEGWLVRPAHKSTTVIKRRNILISPATYTESTDTTKYREVSTKPFPCSHDRIHAFKETVPFRDSLLERQNMLESSTLRYIRAALTHISVEVVNAIET
jgi:hypothetical protein